MPVQRHAAITASSREEPLRRAHDTPSCKPQKSGGPQAPVATQSRSYSFDAKQAEPTARSALEATLKYAFECHDGSHGWSDLFIRTPGTRPDSSAGGAPSGTRVDYVRGFPSPRAVLRQGWGTWPEVLSSTDCRAVLPG